MNRELKSHREYREKFYKQAFDRDVLDEGEGYSPECGEDRSVFNLGNGSSWKKAKINY